ncbi:MAG: ABC transporter permease [Bryobacteraceae bacterium]|nr:ABC transporter permease [Bryobacteraceae bacterium]
MPFSEDLKQSFRSLRRSPTFSAAALALLAVGIGGNAILFTVVKGVLLRPLAVEDPSRLYRIYSTNQARGVARMNVSAGNYLAYAAGNRSFSSVAAFRGAKPGVAGSGGTVQVQGLRVSSGFCSALGVQPLLGRCFTEAEDRQGAQMVALISEGMWKSRFEGRDDVLGKPIELDKQRHIIVGVMPAGIEWPSGTEVWMPLAPHPQEIAARGARYFTVIGRLRPGVSREQAESELKALAVTEAEKHPQSNGGWSVRAEPVLEAMVEPVRPALLTLLSASGLLLLIACANLANLLLVRAAARQRDVAVRIALGASWFQLIRRPLLESALLSAAGAGLGLVIAQAALRAIVAARPDLLPRLSRAEVDWGVVLFTGLLSIVTVLAVGLIPAIGVRTTDINVSLRDGGRGSSEGRSRRRLRQALVMAEVALSVVLLVGAGLVLRTLAKLYAVDTGFRPENLVALQLTLSDSFEERYYWNLLDRALATARGVPGVEAAGAAGVLPLTAANLQVQFQRETAEGGPAGDKFRARYDAVSSGYFEALGAPLKSGRAFSERDNASAPPVVVISEGLARRHFPGEEAVGKRLILNYGNPAPREIVGVVGDMKQQSLEESPGAAIYVPFLQAPLPMLSVIVRTSRADAGEQVRRLIHELDPDVAPAKLAWMEEVVAESTFQKRLLAGLLGAFALLALLLASIGVYGVMAYTVEQRRVEFGVRLAVGAEPGDLRGQVVRQAMMLALGGSVAGFAVAIPAARLLRSMLFGVEPTDPVTLLAVGAILVLVAGAASYFPALRATRVDPVTALRAE